MAPIKFSFLYLKDKIKMLFSKKIRLLKKSGLFRFYSDEDYLNLNNQAKIVFFDAGQPIIEAGEEATTFYVIYSGMVKVYIKDSKGRNIILKRLTSGSYFGEQAFLSGIAQKRNASVVAVTDVEAIEIPSFFLHHVLARHEVLAADLLKTHKGKLLEHLKHHSPFNANDLWREFEDIESEVISLEPETIIFSKGDTPTNVYFIINGSVKIILANDNVVSLTKGQLFGELGVLRQTPRAGTAITEVQTTLIKVPGDAFYHLYESHPKLQALVATLQRVYTIPSRGRVTLSRGELLGLPAVKTTFELDNCVIVALHSSEQNIFSIQKAPLNPAHIARFEQDANNYRELSLYQQTIVGIKSVGEWPSLDFACRLMLDGTPLTQNQINLFIQDGRLSNDEIVAECGIACACIQVTVKTLEQHIAHGVNTLDKLSQVTGAGRVCGACLPRMQMLLTQDDGWVNGKLHFVEDLGKNTRLYRVLLQTDAFVHALPGQFINLRFFIHGYWLERSYSVITSCAKQKSYDIAIKLKESGYVTDWLFQQKNDIMIRASKPEGQFLFDQSHHHPIVYFAGGIGIIPAIPYIRYFNEHAWNRFMHLDYSTKTLEDACFLQELQTTTPSVWLTLNLHITSQNQKLNETEIAQLAKKYPDADFYICGNLPYNEMVASSLRKAGIKEKHIKVEYFVLKELENS